jgi:hypothetical protein
MFSNAPPEMHKKLRQRKAEVDMAAGDDDLVMVVFLALTLVEDPTVLARPLPSFDSLVSNFRAHILIP